MKTEKEIKELVRQKYSEIALNETALAEASCCGSSCCTTTDHIMYEDYDRLEGYNPDADLNLGCGLPTAFAQIKKGDVVVDLGSGAGNDCFVARAETGENGKVIGIDFTEAMINRARENAEKLGLNNVEFRFGDIESAPISSNVADVVVSNCVLNLVPNKEKVFSEIYRMLKPGGHFSISDIVLVGTLPMALQEAAELYVGCVSGAIQKAEYMAGIENAGFVNVLLQKEKTIVLPDEVLSEYLSSQELSSFKSGKTGIYSITVYGEKPSETKNCCEPGCCQ